MVGGGPSLKSCAHWLNWQCGIDLGAAREKVKRIEALKAENHRDELRELSWHVVDDGSYVLNARLTPEQGVRVAQALETDMDAALEERKGVSAETCSPSPRTTAMPAALERRAAAAHSSAVAPELWKPRTR